MLDLACPRLSGRDCGGEAPGFCCPGASFTLMSKLDPSGIGLPPRPFLYTIDQISTLTQIPERTLHTTYIFHEGRDIGKRDTNHMIARNIARPEDTPDWRVVDKEFIKWMRFRGFKYYDRGTFTG